MRAEGFDVEVGSGVAALAPSAWDALAGDDDPFLLHAFLAGLERTGCVGPGTAWRPRPVLVRRRGELVAALPLYERDDSFGEFIFDFAFAGAAERAGLRYYPKLTVAVPFTPASGRRLLHRPDVELAQVLPALLAGLERASQAGGASSVHVLYLREDEQRALTPFGFLPRLSYELQWDRAPTWRSFDDHLAAMTARARKQVRKERLAARGHGLRLTVKRGPELDERDWRGLYSFYRSTLARHGSPPYLTRAFFEHARRELTATTLATLAYRGDEPVAGALFFTRGARLFGRYWGALEELPSMHFELCYHAPLEWALAHGIAHFEGGAQGEHKLKRGLVPTAVYSSHRIHDARLRAAIADYLPREALGVRAEMAELTRHSPYKSSAAEQEV